MIKEILGQPSLEFDGQTFTTYCDLCIYGWIREKKWLYIGISGNGLKRVFRHNIINDIEPVLKKDKILIWSFPNRDYYEVQDLENKLINEFKPKYNFLKKDRKCKEIICPRCKKKFMQKRWWQAFCSKECRY